MSRTPVDQERMETLLKEERDKIIKEMEKTTTVCFSTSLSNEYTGQLKENVISPIVILIILIAGIAPVVHTKAGRKYSFPLAGGALGLLVSQFIQLGTLTS